MTGHASDCGVYGGIGIGGHPCTCGLDAIMRLPLNLDVSGCRHCGRIFTTTPQFDAHRRGTHGVDRHCLPVETLPRWRQNKLGRWTSSKPRLPLRSDRNSTITPDPLPREGSCP